MIILLSLLCFFSGSLMFSYWIGLSINKNIRIVGDGNPGAANLWKAGGIKFGITGIFLDFLKGYLPILFITTNGLISNFQMIPIALAPIFGHAFSPFLKFAGGKSLAVSFGVWSALTLFHVSFVYAIVLAIFSLIIKFFKKGKKVTSEEDGFQTTLGMLVVGIYLFYQSFPSYFLYIWGGNFLLLVYKNKAGILQILKNKKKDEHYSA